MDSFFPGIILIVFACVAIVLALPRAADARGASMRSRVLMLSATGLAGFLLSLGTATPVYGWLYSIFPPMRGLRAAARFGNLFLLAISMLAGIGLAQVRARYPRSAAIAAVAVGSIVLANAEALRSPFDYRVFAGIPRLYGLLVGEQHVVLAEVPFYPPQAAFENAKYVLNSTAHWKPLMNGYSGYTPSSYVDYARVFWYFPRADAIEAMKRAGVTHVMVHSEAFGHEANDVLAAIGQRRDFELMAVGTRGLRLYRLR